MLCSNCLGNTKAPVRRCLPRRSLESSDLSVIPEAVEVPLLEAKCRWRGIAMQGLPRFVQSCVKRNGWSGRLVPPPRAQVGVLHCDGAPAPINLPHHPGTDTGALALVNIAVDVEARMHHRDVRRQKAYMHLRRLAGTRSKRPVGTVQAPHQIPEAVAGLGPCAVDGNELGIVDQRLDHGVRVVSAPCLIEPQFNLADRIFICLGHDDLSHLAAVHARTQLLFAASRLRSVPMLPPRPRTVDPVWSPRRVLERIIHANARRIYGNVQRMRALPAPALVVHREANDEARSDRYRKRGYFGCDRRGGDRECTILSPLRPCSNLYLACLYPQIRGSIRREGVLRTTPFADPNSPEATGGGSLGYDRALPHW